jgi:aminopeptidase-like protein
MVYSLDIEDSVSRIRSGLVLSCVSDQTLLISEGDIRWSNSVTLIVDKNFDFALLHHTDARVGGSQIDTNNCSKLC